MLDLCYEVTLGSMVVNIGLLQALTMDGGVGNLVPHRSWSKYTGLSQNDKAQMTCAGTADPTQLSA